jgi:hypothetical protein
MTFTITQAMGRLSDRLLSPFVPAISAAADSCTQSGTWCCDAAGDCDYVCYNECCCNDSGRLCCQAWVCGAEGGGCSPNSGWSCNTDC